MPHFQLVTYDGEALGATELDETERAPGSLIGRHGHPRLRVVDEIACEDPEVFAILIVERA